MVIFHSYVNVYQRVMTPLVIECRFTTSFPRFPLVLDKVTLVSPGMMRFTGVKKKKTGLPKGNLWLVMLVVSIMFKSCSIS